MPAEASIRFRAESQQARREIQTLRGTLAQLNKTLAEQRNQLMGATAEEQKNIRAHIAANNALKTTMRSQIEQTNLRKQAIAQTQREAKERERLAQQQVREAQRVGKAQEQAARRASAAQSALIADLTRGARVVYQELSRLTTGFVSAAADMETFRNSVQAVTRDTTETNRILAELLQLTVELVGIETGTLISYAGRLMAAGLSAEEAITAIRGVTERIAEQGKSASVTARVMEQLTQSFNAGIATMQDFRPILREMPTFWRDASNALGVQITNLEDFRQAADAAGGNTQALLLVLAEMGRASEGANLDTLNAQIDILSDQARLLQAELGEHLIPAIVAIAKEVNVWIERFRNLDDRAQAAIAWAIALATALTGLSVIVGTATLGFGALSASLAAITGVAGVAGLTAGIGGLTAAFVAAAPFIAVGGIIVGGIALLAKAIRDTSESAQVLRTEITRLDAVTRVYNLTTGQLEEITGDQADAFAQFQQRVKNAQGDVANITNLLQQNRIEQEALTTAMAKASGDAIPELQNQLKSLTAEEQELSQALDDATDKLQNLRFEVVPDDAELTAPIESLEEQLIRAADQVIRLQGAFREVSRGDDIQSIEEAASNLTAALDRELSIQLMNAELTAAERLDLELTHAREVEGVTTDTQNRIRKIAKETTEAQAKAVERQTEAQIAFAARARSAEVARWEAAAASGASYAEQLSEIGSPEHRQRFVQMVEQLQDQGVTLEQARAEAARYIPILAAISNPIQTADLAYQKFSSTLVDESNRSADAVANLLSGVQALGVALGERLPDSEGSLERSLLNERQYFQQNPAGRTLDDIQGEAGEQGRNFVNRLFRRQDREAEKAAIEAQRESIQLYNDLSAATVDFTGSLIDLKGETNLADHAFQDFLGTFGRLATGDFTALLDIPIQLLNISRQAAAEREQGARDRAALYEEQFGEFERFGRNFDVVSGVLGIPESPELSDSLFFNPAGEFENVLAQSTADFSDGIKNALLASVVNLERDIRPEDIAEIFQSSIERLGENLSQSQFNLNFDEQLGKDTADAYNALITDTTAFYQAQIDAINLVRRTTGNLSFGDPEGLARELQAENNRLRLAAPPSGPQNAQQFLAQTGRTRGLAAPTDDQERGVVAERITPEAAAAVAAAETEEAERVAAEALANVIEGINDDVALINASITAVETQIGRASDPEAIAELLAQLPALIQEKYRRLREALDERYAAGQISVDVYNSSLSQLQSGETRDLESHSDAMLANVVRMIDEDILRIDASITDINTQIAGLSDPEAIAALLDELPALIQEKYTRLREALDAKYGAGEISVDVYNASLSLLSSRESGEIEQQSDAMLANVLADIDDDVELIDANIGALQLAVEQSDDPEAIAGLLDAIKILVMDKYRRLRERFTELHDAEEISTDSYNAALTALGTAETRALAGIDTQALEAISTAAQEQVNFINGAIENLRLSLELTDDPAESQQILDAIKLLVGSRFDVLLQELEAIRDSLDPDDFKQAFDALTLGKQLALENIDTQKFGVISAEAQGQVDFINGGIENLRLALQLTDDPAEQQQIIDAIKVLTSARFSVLREELFSIRDSLDPEEFDQALTGINLGEQLSLENLDTEKFQAISEEAQGQVNLINGNIENLRLAIQLTDDPTEQQQIIDAIKTLTVARFRVLRDELLSIRDSLDPEVFDQALTGLNLGEQLALQNLDTESFGVISAAAQGQVDFINGAINNLELALQLTEDPVEIQRIIAAIRTLTGARFDVLIQELKALEDSLDPAIFNQALEGLRLGKAVALRGVDNQAIGVTLSGIGEQITDVDFQLTQLFDDLSEQTTASGVREAIARLRTAITTKYQLLRDKINESAENEEDKARQIEAVDFQEGEALGRLGQQGVGALGNIVDTAQFLLDNATEAQFGTRQQALIDAINDFYDARIEFINSQDLSDTDRTNMAAVAQIQRNIALDAIPQMHDSVTERLELEKDLQSEIAKLKDDALEADRDRANALVDLEQETQERILDIQRKANQSREDIEREFQRDFQDITRERTEAENEVLRQRNEGSLTSDEASQRIEELQRESADRLTELGRERLEDLEDVGIRERRRTQDANIRQERGIGDINAQATATATAIQDALTPLLSEQSTLGTAAEKTDSAATKLDTAAEKTDTAATDLGTVVTGLKDSDIPGAIDLVRQSAEASLGISSAISALPSLLESSFERIFDDLQETIVEILQIESGIQGGVSQYLLDTLIESEGRATGIVGQTAAFALQSLGINPEQFAPPEVEMPTPNMSEITAMVETDVPLDVKVINPDDLYDPAEIERLREDGRNNREIGVHLREIASLAEPTRPDVSMRGLSDLTARIGAAEALSATREVPTSFTADTVNVSGSVVNVSGGNRSGSRESETPQSRFPVEGDELRADITLEFPDGTIQEINNQMLRLKQQDRT